MSFQNGRILVRLDIKGIVNAYGEQMEQQLFEMLENIWMEWLAEIGKWANYK